MSHQPWESLTVRQLFPQLDSETPGNMINDAKDRVFAVRQQLEQRQDSMNEVLDAVGESLAVTNDALGKINDVINAITDTGLYITVISGQEPGKEHFVNVVDHALTVGSLPPFHPNYEENAPNINDSTWVGGVLLLATGPTLADVNDSINDYKKVLEGLSE